MRHTKSRAIIRRVTSDYKQRPWSRVPISASAAKSTEYYAVG